MTSTAPPPVSTLCVCGRLRRATRGLTRLYDEALSPSGLTVTQFQILRTLDMRPPLTLAELAETTAHEKSGLWRTLQPLIRGGLIAHDAVEGLNGRRLCLTSGGEDALARALPAWRDVQARVDARLGARREDLMTLLKEIESLG